MVAAMVPPPGAGLSREVSSTNSFTVKSAKRFTGVRAAAVERVFAATMCRTINDANVLCMGQMIWGDMMAVAAADAFLDTKFTEGLEGLAPFLHEAAKKVEAIDGR